MNSATSGQGNGGNITINSNTVELKNISLIIADTYSTNGDSGQIEINAENTLSLTNISSLYSI